MRNQNDEICTIGKHPATLIDDKLILPRELGLMVKTKSPTHGDPPAHFVFWGSAMSASAIKDLHIFENYLKITRAFYNKQKVRPI